MNKKYFNKVMNNFIVKTFLKSIYSRYQRINFKTVILYLVCYILFGSFLFVVCMLALVMPVVHFICFYDTGIIFGFQDPASLIGDAMTDLYW